MRQLLGTPAMCPAPLQDFKYLQSDDRYTQKHLADDGERDRGKIREGRVGEEREGGL